MSISEVMIKIALFFAIFYGAIGISSFISKKIIERREDKDKE